MQSTYLRGTKGFGLGYELWTRHSQQRGVRTKGAGKSLLVEGAQDLSDVFSKGQFEKAIADLGEMASEAI